MVQAPAVNSDVQREAWLALLAELPQDEPDDGERDEHPDRVHERDGAPTLGAGGVEEDGGAHRATASRLDSAVVMTPTGTTRMT